MDVTPTLICVPSTDVDFAARAQAVLATLAIAELEPDLVRSQLETRLRADYPGVIVRPREQIAGFGQSREVVWYVTRRRYGSRLNKRLEIAAQPGLVFSVYVDHFADWMKGLQFSSTRLQPGYVGTEYSARYEILGQTLEGRFRVVEADFPRSVRVEAEGVGGIRVWYITTFGWTATGTLVEVVGDYDIPGRLFPGIERGFEAIINHNIDRSHQSLRAYCLREQRRLGGG